MGSYILGYFIAHLFRDQDLKTYSGPSDLKKSVLSYNLILCLEEDMLIPKIV